MGVRTKASAAGREKAVWEDGHICLDASKTLQIELAFTSYSTTLTPSPVNGTVICSELQSWNRREFRLVVEPFLN